MAFYLFTVQYYAGRVLQILTFRIIIDFSDKTGGLKYV